jgi:hypothetical protein
VKHTHDQTGNEQGWVLGFVRATAGCANLHTAGPGGRGVTRSFRGGTNALTRSSYIFYGSSSLLGFNLTGASGNGHLGRTRRCAKSSHTQLSLSLLQVHGTRGPHGLCD